MSTKEFQNTLVELLREEFQELGLEVCKEWHAFAGFQNQYSPNVDIAIGPFSIERGGNRIDEYNDLINQLKINRFLRLVYETHVVNIGDQYLNEITIPRFEDILIKNQNARCLIAIEIENENSRKHTMGSIINAASLGRVGIGVAYSEKALKLFIRILNYLGFLKRVEKNTYDTTNFMIITKEQVEDILEV